MLIRNNTLTESANSILENATYLYESEMPNVSAYSIPVVANDRFNAGIVSYEDISRLCESYGLDIIDGIRAVAEANQIDPNDVVVSIDESTIISDPWVVDEVHQYVVAPVSESNLVSQFTDIMVDSFLESGDDFYLEAIAEPKLVLEEKDDRAYADGNFVSSDQLKDYYSKAGKAMKDFGKQSTKIGDKTIKPDDPNFLVKIKRFLTDKPREYLSRAVARLRQTYRKFLLRADKENDENKIKWYKQIARKILQAVDWVLSKIQKAATVKYGGRLVKAKAAYADKLKDSGKGNKSKPIDNNQYYNPEKLSSVKRVDGNSHYDSSKQPERVKGTIVDGKVKTDSGKETNSEPVNKGGQTFTKDDIGKNLGNGYYVGVDLKPRKRNPNSTVAMADKKRKFTQSQGGTEAINRMNNVFGGFGESTLF